jgi:hypothetical protein
VHHNPLQRCHALLSLSLSVVLGKRISCRQSTCSTPANCGVFPASSYHFPICIAVSSQRVPLYLSIHAPDSALASRTSATIYFLKTRYQARQCRDILVLLLHFTYSVFLRFGVSRPTHQHLSWIITEMRIARQSPISKPPSFMETGVQSFVA